jgi:multidrug transporter EmrE-like cation transporter
VTRTLTAATTTRHPNPALCELAQIDNPPTGSLWRVASFQEAPYMNPVPEAAVAAGIRSPEVALFILGSALCYCAAMTLMKLWDGLPLVLVGLALGVCIVGAVWLEILALRQARLGMVYVAILGAEAVMLALIFRFGFGETFSTREVAGAALIVTGTMLSAT